MDAQRRKYTSWDDVPFEIKRQFFNTWSFVVVAGAISAILSSFFGILSLTGSGYMNYYHLMLGFAAFSFAISTIRYLEFVPKLHALALTVKIAMSRVFYMVVSVAPIVFAYASFGVVVFARFSDRFETFDNCMVTLFALVNGDDIKDTFNQLGQFYAWEWVARIYVYTFVAFFITTVLNVFIFIIEDAFQAAKLWTFGDHDHVEPNRRPFDICVLFDIIEQRHREQRRHTLHTYFRTRQQQLQSPVAATSSSSSGGTPLDASVNNDVPNVFDPHGSAGGGDQPDNTHSVINLLSVLGDAQAQRKFLDEANAWVKRMIVGLLLLNLCACAASETRSLVRD